MRISVGTDVAKEVHWATTVDDASEVFIDRPVSNKPSAIGELAAVSP